MEVYKNCVLGTPTQQPDGRTTFIPDSFIPPASAAIPPCNLQIHPVHWKPSSQVKSPPQALSRVDYPTILPERAFTLSDVLSRAECDSIIATSAPHHRSLNTTFPTEYRNGTRALLRSHDIAETIFTRVMANLTAADIAGIRPMCFGHGGVWYPVRCNEVVKVNEYTVGGRFAAHRDGPWIPKEHYASIFTVLIYLNDVPAGGETVLYPETAVQEMIKEDYTTDRCCVHLQGMYYNVDIAELGAHTHAVVPSLVHPELTYEDCALNQMKATEKVWTMADSMAGVVKVKPKTGTALIFQHQVLHSGMPVTAGTKLVLRTEIIFRRVQSLFMDNDLYLTDEKYWAARKLYDESRRAEAAGDTTTFVRLYEQVVDLQRQQLTPNIVVPTTTLSHIWNVQDIRSVVFTFLAPSDRLCMMRTSKGMYFAVLHCGEAWRHTMMTSYANALLSVPKLFDAGGVLPAAYDTSVAWFDLYRRRKTVNSRFLPHMYFLTPDGALFFPPGTKKPPLEVTLCRLSENKLQQNVSNLDWVLNDYYGCCVLSSREGEGEMSAYHFHMSDDERFSTVTLNIIDWQNASCIKHVSWVALCRGAQGILAEKVASYAPHLIIVPPNFFSEMKFVREDCCRDVFAAPGCAAVDFVTSTVATAIDCLCTTIKSSHDGDKGEGDGGVISVVMYVNNSRGGQFHVYVSYVSNGVEEALDSVKGFDGKPKQCAPYVLKLISRYKPKLIALSVVTESPVNGRLMDTLLRDLNEAVAMNELVQRSGVRVVHSYVRRGALHYATSPRFRESVTFSL